MAAFIKGMKDSLDLRNAEFPQAELKQTVFLNSVPKGGTHLLRNILRMFIPPAQHYHHDFIQIPNLNVHGRALAPEARLFSCGHLLFSDQTAAALRQTRHVLLIRDPYDWVLARARFHLSDEFQQANLAHLKTGVIGGEELLNLMILGIHQKTPSLLDIYMHNAVGWLGTSAFVVKYEDIVAALDDLESRRSEVFFRSVLDNVGIDPIPEDWRERVVVGADRRQSRTARENLNLPDGVVLPDTLPKAQRRLVDFLAPGLRPVLGYA